jgi:hypothetical protein
MPSASTIVSPFAFSTADVDSLENSSGRDAPVLVIVIVEQPWLRNITGQFFRVCVGPLKSGDGPDSQQQFQYVHRPRLLLDPYTVSRYHSNLCSYSGDAGVLRI